MKKFLITALALVAGVSVAMAGMGISWGDGGGWMVVNGGDLNDGPGIADANDVLWQLIYAGENGKADDIDLTKTNYLGGDDKLLADREIPSGGGSAADGTSWDGWLMKQGGTTVYEDLSWNTDGKVFQRIFQGTPAEGSFYYQTGLVAIDTTYGSNPDVPSSPMMFDYADQAGVSADRQIPGTPQVPEPATMSLLGLGALAMVIRRKLRK